MILPLNYVPARRGWRSSFGLAQKTNQKNPIS